MGTTLVIAEGEMIVVYAMENGLFDEVIRLTFKKKPNHSTIVQYVTAVSQVVNNGKNPPKRPTTVELLDRADKKAAAKKRHPTASDYINTEPVKDKESLFKALAGFETWTAVDVAHEAVGRHNNSTTFYSHTREAFLYGYLEKRDEPVSDRKARDARGRVATQYRLTERGLNKLQELRKEALGTD